MFCVIMEKRIWKNWL